MEENGVEDKETRRPGDKETGRSDGSVSLSPCLPFLPRQRNPCRLAPQILERVVASGFGIEQVNDDGAVIQQYPAAFVVAFDAHPMIAQFAFQYPVDFFADGVQLAAAVAGNEHEVIEFRRHAPHIERDDFLAAVFLGRAGRGQRKLLTSFLANFECGGCLGDGGKSSGDAQCAKSRGPILTTTPSADEGTASQTGRRGDRETRRF